MRTDDLRRRSTGAQYWLLLPAAPFLMYAALIWGVVLGMNIVLSPFSRLLRAVRRA